MENNYNQDDQWQHADANMGVVPPVPQMPPGRPGRAARVIGFIALFLAVAIIFSAVSGIVVYRYTRATAPQETQINKLPDTSQTKPQEEDGNSVDKQLLNPYFDLSEAAGRRVAGKKTLSVMEIAQIGKPAVVAITTKLSMTDMFGQEYRPQAAGSGFIVSADGYIVTNNHVIEGADTITVVLDNDEMYEAVLVGTDPANDIAVIKIKENDLPTVVLGDSADLVVGELSVAIGNPLGELSGTVTAGIISGLDREISLSSARGVQKMRLLQTDAAINAGNSGGALFNSFGEVIGINTAKNIGAGVEGLGFAIPIDHAKPIIESLIQYGYMRGRPKIGIVARNISAQMADYYKVAEGILVMEIEPDSAADLAGLQKNDIIIAAEGAQIKTIDELNELKDTFKPGMTFSITVLRQDKRIELDLTLQEDLPDEYRQTSQQ